MQGVCWGAAPLWTCARAFASAMAGAGGGGVYCGATIVCLRERRTAVLQTFAIEGVWQQRTARQVQQVPQRRCAPVRPWKPAMPRRQYLDRDDIRDALRPDERIDRGFCIGPVRHREQPYSGKTH